MTANEFIDKWQDDTVPTAWRDDAASVYWIRSYRLRADKKLEMAKDLLTVPKLASSSSVQDAHFTLDSAGLRSDQARQSIAEVQKGMDTP